MTSFVALVDSTHSATIPGGFIFIGTASPVSGSTGVRVTLQGVPCGPVGEGDVNGITANGGEVFTAAYGSYSLNGQLYDITAFATSLIFAVSGADPYPIPTGKVFVGRATNGSGVADAVLLQGLTGSPVQIGDVTAGDVSPISADAGWEFTASTGYTINGLLFNA